MFGSTPSTPFGTGAFGTSNTTAFGGGQSNLFGQSSGGFFGAKTQTGSAFGTPSFGTSTSSSFGSGTTSSGLFGTSNTGTSLFSQPTTQSTGFTFGQSTGGSLFGASSQPSSLFQTPQSTNVFGQNKTSGFGTGLFGSSFGSTATTSSTTGSIFSGTTSVFGGGSATNGTTVKFNPVTNSESVVKNGVSVMVQTKHQCISVMKEYEAKSLEELRLEDYAAGRKSGSAGTTSLFGSSSQPAQTQSLFGSTTGSAFGQNKAFGGFGQTNTSTGGLFGQTSQSGGLFGSKPTGTGSIFGAAKTTASTGFGFGTSTGLLGQTSTAGTSGSLFGSTGQSTGLFGASSGFGTTQTTSTGGLFGTSTFGQTQPGGLLGATSKPFGFGATSTGTSAFGTNTFGAGTSTSLFGNTATTKPAFSFNTPGTGFGSSLGTGFGANNTLGTGLFGASNTGTSGTGLFGAQNKTGIGTGLGTSTGLGTGFGGTSLFGGTGFGGAAAGTGLTANQNLAGINQSSFAAFQQQQVLQQQLKALSNSPFGDSPLFRNLTASRTKQSDASVSGPAARPNTAASHYKVFSKPSIKVKMKPSPFLSSTKSKLFEDMYDDQSLGETQLTPRKSVKKLVIKNKLPHLTNGDVNGSPLRFRAPNDHDDHDDLVSRTSHTSSPALLDDGATRDEGSNSALESPALQQARKKTQGRLLGRQSEEPDETVTQLAVDSDADNGNDSDQEEENTNACGIILERSDYYTIPSIEELNKLSKEGQCMVDDFVVGREDYGEVKFLGETDVQDLNLDEIVFFRRREAEVYPDDYANKPKVGYELNKKSEVSLHKVWPNDKTSHTPIKSPDRLKKSGFLERLEEKTSAMGALFLDYKPETGTWVFQVEHFTRYGLNEQLFADDDKDDLLNKLKMAAQKKEAARLSEQKVEKEKAESIEQAAKLKTESAKSETVLEDEASYSQIDMDEDVIRTNIDAELPRYKEEYRGNIHDEVDALSSSVQNAKITGIDPGRLQGLKALLFDDNEDDFMSPREKLFLSNKSLITGSIRQSELKDRFDSASKLKDEREKLDFSLLSETNSPVPSPKKLSRKSYLLKTSAIIEERALFSGKRDPATSEAFPVEVKDFSSKRPPRIIPPTRGATLVPFQESSLKSRECLIADAGLANGQRFRVGWAPKLRLVHVGRPVGETCDLLTQQMRESEVQRASIFDSSSRVSPVNLSSNFTVKLEDIDISDNEMDDTYITNCLKTALKHSIVNTDCSAAPLIEPVRGVEALHAFAELTENFIDRKESFQKTDVRYQHAIVWDLAKALWGRLEYGSQVKLTAYQQRMYRRAAVSKWLSDAVEHDIKNEVDTEKFKDGGYLAAIFSLLTGRKINAACKIAYQNREFRLALLLSQACGDVQTKHLLGEQLAEWRDQKADKFMDNRRLKIYQLLSGIMVWMSSNGDINLCEDLDWKRAFALHLWYYCPTTSSIAKALEHYKNSFKGTGTYASYAEAPKPCYVSKQRSKIDKAEEENEKQPKDICYHLLKLFSKRSHRLENLLCPNTHTSNPLDYHLCWQLQQALEALDYTHLSENYHCLLQISFASQLETYGLWEWAVFVASHIKNHQRREMAVRDILSRHCLASEDCSELSEKETFLIESVKIPARWIYEAKALHARYMKKPYDEVVYLLKAGHWNSAHSILLSDLVSDAIIDHDYDTLKGLLMQLSLPERCCTVKDWTLGGEIFLDFILLTEKLSQIEQEDILTSAYNLEDLRGDVTSLINRIGKMTAHTAKERLAQAEMGKTASNLLKIVLNELSSQGCKEEDDDEEELDAKYTWSMCEIAPFIAYLPLPPDYKQRELEELVSGVGDMD